MNILQKLVKFEKYCKRCVYKDLPDSEDPCDQCMCYPANGDSHKPVFFKDKEEEK